jgi:hypothetical protein
LVVAAAVVFVVYFFGRFGVRPTDGVGSTWSEAQWVSASPRRRFFFFNLSDFFDFFDFFGSAGD